MKQTNFKSIVHRALSTVNRNSALCIVNRAPIIALLFVLMLGVGNVWGATYTKVSSVTAGKKYLVVYYASNSYKVFNGNSPSTSGTSSADIKFSPTDGVATGDFTSYTVTITNSHTSGKYLVQCAHGEYIGRSASSNGLNTTTTKPTSGTDYDNNIQYDSSNKYFVIAGSGGRALGSNSGTWKYYSTTNAYTHLDLYEEATSSTPSKVTFNAGSNGSCTTSSLTEEPAGAGVTLPSCTPNTGYRFEGWATTSEKAAAGTADAGAAGATYKPSADITLYAVYVQQFDVTWYINNVPTKKTVDKGSLLTIPDDLETGIDCNGREFLGWTATANYTSADTAPSDLFTVASGTVTENLNFYAVYAAVKQE